MRTSLCLCASASLCWLFSFSNLRAEEDAGHAARQQILRERFLHHFTLGVDAPSGWIAETNQRNGTRWDTRGQYLSGEVGGGKAPWWSGAVDPRLTDDRKTGTVTWLTFYMLANSAPAHYKPGPAQASPANAKVASTMREYFEWFKRLMLMCGKRAPHPVVVQIEPDEWCHLLLSANMDPAAVNVKVGSCGLEELKGLPDNLFGFASAFQKLRDLYAPRNVLLGCNPSAWDWKGKMSGKNMGETFKKLCPDWELAVFETCDRDKGMSGWKPPYGTEITFTGNLENHIKWITDFHAASGLYVVVWQVAAGNTYFAACNNTKGHYCDNLPQMLLEDYPRNNTLARYAQAGCCGWIFLPGQWDQGTHVNDFMKDGVTNPPAIAGNLGHSSEYSDDDGGYIRLRGAAYYKDPYLFQKSKPSVEFTAPDAGTANVPPAPVADGTPAAPANASIAGGTPALPAASKGELKLADSKSLAVWEAKLKKRVQEELAAGRHPRLKFSSLKSEIAIQTLDDKGEMQAGLASGGVMALSWSQFQQSDLIALALGSIREAEPQDHALGAFYLLLDNQFEKARMHFQQCVELEDAVRREFQNK